MRRAQPEAAIQKAVFDHLRCRAAPHVFAFHCPNGGFRRPREAARLKELGVVPGVPDVIAITPGQTYALELKADKGRLSEVQINTLVYMGRCGVIYGVAYGLDEAIAWLEGHKLLRVAA